MFDETNGFNVQPNYLIRCKDTGDLAAYVRDSAHPRRRPSLYAVEVSVVYPDGEKGSETVCYMRTQAEAEKYAAKLAATS